VPKKIAWIGNLIFLATCSTIFSSLQFYFLTASSLKEYLPWGNVNEFREKELLNNFCKNAKASYFIIAAVLVTLTCKQQWQIHARVE
jgi:hypothetical protein